VTDAGRDGRGRAAPGFHFTDRAMLHIKSRKHTLRHGHGRSTAMTGATLAASLALALPSLATAQQPAPDGAANSPDYLARNTLPEVTVEGDLVDDYKVDEVDSPKFVKPLLDTPQTIQVISSDLFQSQAATTLTEALRNSPGVGTFYVGENGNTSTGDAVYLRGFDTSGSIFVDGVRDLGSISRDVFDTEQIEVTKGPAGTDNGRTAPAGAINLVTKQPFAGDAGQALVSWGSADQKRVTADFNGDVGAAGGTAFRLNVMGQESGVPGRDQVENNRWGIAPSVVFGLGTPTRVFLDYLHIRHDNVPDGGVPTIGLPGYSTPDPERPEIGLAPRVDSENFYGTDADHDRVTADMFTAIVEHDFSDDLKLHNVTRWGRTRQDYLLTSWRVSTDDIVTPDLGDPSTWTIARGIPTFKHQNNRILANQTNLRLHSEGGGVENDLSTGLELTSEKLTTVGIGALDDSTWPPANLYDPDPHVSGLAYGKNGADASGETRTAAVYAFDTVTLEHWQFNAGVRLDHYDTEFSSRVPCGGRRAPPCGDLPDGTIVPGVDADVSDSLFNWKIGALYKPAENGSVYANYAISQQPPGGAALELSASENNPNNPAFDPQKANTAELGTKWELLDGRLLLTGAWYRTEVTNEIVQDPVDQLYYQTGEKRVQGIEVGAVGFLSDNWAVSAGFTTMDASVEEGDNVSQDGSDDLAYTPKRAFTSWSTWTLPFDLQLGLGARYSGEMKRGRDGAIGTPDHTEDYWVFDAVASYPVSDNLDLRLNVYNLFDTDYVAAINKSGYRYTPGVPRTFLLTANLHF
jgi:catecholate siderophore receptor